MTEQQTAFDTATMDQQQAAPASQAKNETRKRAPRSDKGKKHTQPTPGTVVVRFEASLSESVDMLGYFMRTGKTAAAHALVDAIAKAQKQETTA